METRFEELKRYARLTADDARLLRELRPLAAPQFETIAREFFDRIREHEEAYAVFTGEPQIARLERALVRWLERLLSGNYDEGYFEDAAKVGRMHVKAGVPQRYMFTAIALVRVALARVADDQCGDAAPATREALMRLLDLELAVMFETYRDSFVARLQRVDEHGDQAPSRAAALTHRFADAVEFAHVLIVGVDAAGCIRLFNREAERVTGFERDEVLGCPFAETLFADEVLVSHGARVRAVATGERATDEILDGMVRTRARRLRDVHWHLAFAPSSTEDEIVLFAVGRDTSDERRTIERARQQEKLAAVGTLAAGLAHEIRNPLNGARLHVSFLERSLKLAKADGKLLEAVGVVGDEIGRLATLVTEFLDFARSKPLEVESVSVQEICKRTEKLLSAPAALAHVRVACDLPPRDLRLMGDAAKLEQVLLNVVRNAIDAVAPTGGAVTIRARRNPRHAVIEVEDDGPGLGSPDAPIYDAFYSTKATGTGLGLAIVHRIVLDHRGSIDVESRPGRTCFRITLPLGTSEAPATVAAPAATVPIRAASSRNP
jgi:PAS domain S-box-containing protein